MIPLCGWYLFACLSALYSAKSAPLHVTPFSRLALTHLLAAALISGLWVLLARGLAALFSYFGAFPGIRQRFFPLLPLLFGLGVLLYLLSVAYHYVILSIEASRETETRMMETTVLARDAELKALKAQLNPHFLFNSLNSISALTSIDPERAREMCILLAEFLRMTLGLGEKNSISLGEELEMLDRFVAIEKVRFGARLRVEEEVAPESKRLQVPPLLLQPLMENAVGHGIANLPEGGTIRLAAQSVDSRLTIWIENSFDPESTVARRNGMGLMNVRRRLEARYGTAASLNAKAEGHVFRVDVSLPAEVEEERA
jgi:LytS/YehU family sensor histidine kinase